MPVPAAARQAKRRAALKVKGVFAQTVHWSRDSAPELRALADLLLANPDCTFIPAFRDPKGRIHFMKENRG